MNGKVYYYLLISVTECAYYSVLFQSLHNGRFTSCLLQNEMQSLSMSEESEVYQFPFCMGMSTFS